MPTGSLRTVCRGSHLASDNRKFVIFLLSGDLMNIHLTHLNPICIILSSLSMFFVAFQYKLRELRDLKSYQHQRGLCRRYASLAEFSCSMT